MVPQKICLFYFPSQKCKKWQRLYSVPLCISLLRRICQPLQDTLINPDMSHKYTYSLYDRELGDFEAVLLSTFF